mmetsp:Transcript_10207/g.41261  ORF Transcript_10207/g.41261 Transcript_10207/m.41261 type:complete len:275 (+) Transcript_10207:862-1686(+)
MRRKCRTRRQGTRGRHREQGQDVAVQKEGGGGARDVGQVTRQPRPTRRVRGEFRGVAGAKPAESRDVAEPGAAVRGDGAGRSGAQGVRSRGGDLRRGRRRDGDVWKKRRGGRRRDRTDRTDARTGRRRSSGGRVRRGGEAGARRGEGGGGAALRGGVRASRPAAQGAQVLRALDGRFAPGDSRGTGDGGADAMRAQGAAGFQGEQGEGGGEEARDGAVGREALRRARSAARRGRRGGRRAQRVDGGKLRAAMGRVAAGEAGVESSVLQDGGAAT